MMEDIPQQHALNCAWSVWEHRDDKNSYEDNMHKLCSFRTIEEFWGYWNNIPKPSESLFDGTSRKRFVDRSVGSFSVFKDGIKPEWEDEQNAKGGEWFMKKKLQPEVANDFWEKLVLLLIGEAMDPDDEITGARIVYKHPSFFRLEVWLKSRDLAKAETVRHEILNKLNTGTSANAQLVLRDWMYKEHNAAH